MIPVTLRLKNFMSYREGVEPLDFSQFHLACLSGENGHGKSTLLDAITWAIWGKARATSDDQLIALGADHMEVEFVFQLGETRYRVLRKRAKRGKTSTMSVDFFLCGAHGDIPRSGNSARETNAIITQLIGLDYDTFVRSSFLQQGQADKFTKEQPARRKELLAAILGLDIYDWLERRAKDRARDAEAQIVHIDNDIARIDYEIAQKPRYEANLERAAATLEAMEQEQSHRATKIAHLQQQRALLEKDAERAETLTVSRKRERDRRDATAKRATDIATRISAFESVLADRDAIVEGYAVLEAARAIVTDQQTRAAALVALQRERAPLENAIASERVRLERERARLASEIDQARKNAEHLDETTSRLAEVEATVASFAATAERIAQQRARASEITATIGGHEARKRQLKTDMNEIKRLIDEIRASPICWVCGQTLDGDHLDHAIAMQTARGVALGDEYRELNAAIGDLQRQLADLSTQISADESDNEKRRNAANREAGQLRQRLADAQTAQQRLAQWTPKLEAIEQQLAANAYAVEAQAKLAAIDERIVTIAFDDAALESARARVRQFEGFQSKHDVLLQADTQMIDLRGDLERYQQDLAECDARIAALDAEIATLAEAKSALAAVSETLRMLNAEQADRASALAAARAERIRAEQRLQACLDLIPERERLVGLRQAVADEKGVFDELTAAFGKRGVQAMLIEAVLPELEECANELLARMTEGRLNVRFQTQRASRSADSVIETLDIVITDELGSRNYEMFSGGEAFRVDFALRVALAKLLARRAGAQLQTLIVDEGFGTQDAAGRERLIEAITAIEDDFEKILVVTHIEELKEAFPTRIEVVKTEVGSRYSVQTR